MKIATLTKSYPAPGSPAEGSFIRSRMAAVAKRADVRVLHAVPFTRPLPPDDPDDSPPVFRCRYRYVPGVGKAFDHRFLARLVRRTLRAWAADPGIDILDAHFGYPEGAAAVRLGRELGVPVAVTLRGTEKEFAGRGGRGREMARAIAGADLVIAVSESLAELGRELGAPAERVTVIGNGADVERFAPGNRDEARAELGLPGGGPVLLSVGMLIERKGHHHLIRMLPEIARVHPETVLVVVGAGPWEGRLRRLADRVGVADRVRFTGLVDRDRIPAYYRAADLLLLATRWEGFANVYFEAFASGIPVVTTDAGGAREAVPSEEFGVVVGTGEWEEFRRGILSALERDWSPEALREYALAHTWDRVGAKVLAAFRAVLPEET